MLCLHPGACPTAPAVPRLGLAAVGGAAGHVLPPHEAKLAAPAGGVCSAHRLFSLPRIIQQIFAGFFANSAIPGSQHPFSW